MSDTFNFYFKGERGSFSADPPTRRILPIVSRTHMAFALLDDQQTTLHASGVDAAGNPVADSNPITWTVDDPSILTITPASDGLSCLVVTTGKVGNAIVKATTPSGVQGQLDIEDDFPITVTTDTLSGLNIIADAPTSRLIPPTSTAPPTPPDTGTTAPAPVQPPDTGTSGPTPVPGP